MVINPWDLVLKKVKKTVWHNLFGVGNFFFYLYKVNLIVQKRLSINVINYASIDYIVIIKGNSIVLPIRKKRNNFDVKALKLKLLIKL